MSSTAAKSAWVGERTLVHMYVWQVPVRVTHWLIALSLAVLAVTGIYIGHPFLAVSSGPAARHFVTGTVKVVHFYAAIVFTVSALARVLWMFLGNEYSRWYNFLPFRRGSTGTFKFYVFWQRDPPGVIGHNPLAGTAYAAVFFLYFVEIFTGLTLYGVSAHVDSPLRAFAALAPWLGGLQMTRWIHHAGMWLLLGFFVHHLYSAAMMAMVERNGIIDSMVSGYKFVHRPEQAADWPGRRR